MKHTLLAMTAGLGALVVFFACNGGLPRPINATTAVPTNATPGIPFALGVLPNAPITDVTIAGAAVPTLAGSRHQVILTAFTTAAAANDASGNGGSDDPIDLGTPTPSDSNGQQDVFLAAMVSSQGDTSGAFGLRLFAATQHPRCFTCHGQDYPSPCSPSSSHPNHNTFDTGGGVCAPQPTCTTSGCHTAALTGVPEDFDADPASTSDPLGWHAPPTCDGMGGCTVFDFRNRSVVDICTGIAHRLGDDPNAVKDHLKNDPLIRWALPFDSTKSGHTPDGNVRTTVPIPFSSSGPNNDWQDFVDAWVDHWDLAQSDESKRFNCTSVGSRRDVKLVSRSLAGNSAGDASSRRPSITYVPMSPFTPPASSGATAIAGTVYVAFDSDADDLVAGDTNGVADVFRAQFDLVVDFDFVNGDPTQGSIRLVPSAPTIRVSVQDSTGAQGSGRATAPSISPSGDRIAFVSEDSNLVDVDLNSAFDDDTNGADDVFVHEVSTGLTRMVSVRSDGFAPANGDSAHPTWAVNSENGVAFESDASDIVAGDTNGARDVFYALIPDGTIHHLHERTRASVRSGGAEGLGGDATSPSMYVIDHEAGDVVVAFESSMTNLAPVLPPNSTRNVYVFESLAQRTTLMNQKFLPLQTIGSAQGGAAPADSRRPAISADGKLLFFDSLADDIDVLRPSDTNGAADVFQVDLETFLGNGRIRPQRVSVAEDGSSGSGASTSARSAAFVGPGDAGGTAFVGRPIVFDTTATNLQHDASNAAVLVFTP